MTALIIQNLEKIYSTGVNALKSISLQVEAGDFFGLLGPNGAGKSTTIGIITSLVKKTRGIVKVFNHDLDEEPEAVKAKIGLVPQEFNFNIFDKVQQILLKQAGYHGIGYHLAAERSEKYLKTMGLWEKRNTQARFLSGGQKRRLLIARALVHEPALLILDEPTAGVDIELRREMWHFLRKLNEQGTTIILTTHYLEEAEQLCKNIAIIDEGKIIENTSLQALLRKQPCESFILNMRESIKAIPDLAPFQARIIDEHNIEVDIYAGQFINDLFELLTREKIYVSTLRNKVNRLEEFYLRLTSGENSYE